jgi:hypothetical protein
MLSFDGRELFHSAYLPMRCCQIDIFLLGESCQLSQIAACPSAILEFYASLAATSRQFSAL